MLALGRANAILLPETMARAERSESDDAVSFEQEGLFWYLHLRMRQFREAGLNGPAIESRTGITKQQVGQIQRGQRSGGLLTLIRLARGDGVSAGQMLDTALAWWEEQGKGFRERAIHDLATERASGKKPPRVKTRRLGTSLGGIDRRVSKLSAAKKA